MLCRGFCWEEVFFLAQEVNLNVAEEDVGGASWYLIQLPMTFFQFANVVLKRMKSCDKKFQICRWKGKSLLANRPIASRLSHWC